MARAATKSSATDRPTKGTPTGRWRVIDIVVASVIAVAVALLYFSWNLIYSPVTAPLEAALPGLQALLYGVWLIGGVLGGLIIRKPGAALYVSLVAATVSALLGSQWGLLTLESGLVQGLGAELVFLAFSYSNWRPIVAVLAGAASGLALGINDLVLWFPGATPVFAVIYASSAIVSGAVIAGLGSWFLVQALAATGALSRFASGRQ
ncbi:MAG: ECF transporter S component [Salinibacterium sp.]|nr:ECF transporter S component [Salinibacterium sp.]